MRPHRRQPTRLPRPWGSPGKNTGVGCHFLLQCMKVKSDSEVSQSCLTLSDPMDCSPPGFSVHGIFQARVLEWVAIAFSVSTRRPNSNYTAPGWSWAHPDIFKPGVFYPSGDFPHQSLSSVSEAVSVAIYHRFCCSFSYNRETVLCGHVSNTNSKNKVTWNSKFQGKKRNNFCSVGVRTISTYVIEKWQDLKSPCKTMKNIFD